MTSPTTGSFLDDLSSAVQANPVPAALIGMGALWMLMGGGRTTAAAALLASGASRAADSLAPKQVGQLMFPIAQKYVEKVVLVEDDAILASQRALWSDLRITAEAGGAAAYAALISGKYQPGKNERVGVLVCGGNTTAVSFEK